MNATKLCPCTQLELHRPNFSDFVRARTFDTVREARVHVPPEETEKVDPLVLSIRLVFFCAVIKCLYGSWYTRFCFLLALTRFACNEY